MNCKLKWDNFCFPFVHVKLFIFRNFQTFEAPQAPVVDPHQPYVNVPPNQYGGSFLDTSQIPPSGLYGQGDFGQQAAYTGNEFDDEPPLLEGDPWFKYM